MGNNWQNSTMKKKLILIAFALILSVASFAQQQLAVLNHNNTITAYYGADALISAHNAAETGDIITLSSGVFNATNITKAVTIRGAGAWADTTGGNTMVSSGFVIDVAQDETHHLTIEGIYVPGSIIIYTAYNPQFIKCFFQRIGLGEGPNDVGTGSNNASFVNCILALWRPFLGGYWNPYCNAVGTQFVNSVIMDCNAYSNYDTYINCVLKQNPSDASSRIFQNCVLYWDYTDTIAPANNGTTSFNCLFVQMNADSFNADNLYFPSVGHTLWNIRGMSNVFQTFNGSTEGENFELLSSVASTYLGTDGTQIGIYGGAMPFNPRVTSPLIRRITVAPRSNANGQLPVDIEVSNE